MFVIVFYVSIYHVFLSDSHHHHPMHTNFYWIGEVFFVLVFLLLVVWELRRDFWFFVLFWFFSVNALKFLTHTLISDGTNYVT